MKLTKSYTAIIDGNKSKLEYLTSTLKTLQEMSDYIFSLGKEKWFDQKPLYHELRLKYPTLKSKILQQFMQEYLPIRGKKNPKKAIKASIILDDQNFSIKLTENKLTSIWLKFHIKKFPLFSKYLLEKLKQVNLETQVKCCQIFMNNNKLYCKVSLCYEIMEQDRSSNPIAIDINTKCIVSSDNKFYNTKRLFHTRYERNKKNKWKSKNISNLTKNTIHLLSNKIISDLKSQGSEVLVLEDLKFSSRKKGFNKVNNFILNTFYQGQLRNVLEYKCIEAGIKTVKVNPEYTSKVCWNCGSLNTQRPKQNSFVCMDCNNKIHADLNASRNILDCYENPKEFLKLHPKWATNQSSRVEF